MLKKLSALCLLSLLVGCDNAKSIREICDENSQFCADLNTDSHCNTERADVILGRYAESKTPDDATKYKLLSAFHDYAKCVELAASIEHIKLKEKTTSRVNGHLTALKEINRLSKDTRNSQYPHLLFYHWSRNGDEGAIQSLIAMDEKRELETSEFQYKLATYYTKFDSDLAIDKLYHALELNPAGNEAKPEIYTALTNMFYQMEEHKLSYIWALVAKEAGVQNIDLAPLEYELTNQGKSLSELANLAADTLSRIEDGNFTSPR